ncbi:EAL domain-containing response regulator, partial [Pseudomonas sp. NPDC089530]|uniref:EAL domain-containing response regulator n=1 Tax=Pseudomonas sp. NPDC089530 TaxID=3390651 RepID=UPI003D08E3D9
MKPCSILIVEDHPFQHMYLQHLFGELGPYYLEGARDGEEALERLKWRKFDLVLTDLLMPGMDGVQFIQGLATLPYKPALAIMSSASRRMLMSASLAAKNLGVKVIGLISKPVNLAALQTLTTQLSVSQPSSPHPLPTALLTQATLAQAIRDEQFEAWFQPKKSLFNGRIVAAEALVRWMHPTRGMLLPDAFLPAIKSYDLEEDLLWLVLRQTIQAQARWRQQDYDIPVSINLPTHLLNSHDLADRLFDFVL